MNWISVKDKNPIRDEKVMIYDEEGYIDITKFYTDDEKLVNHQNNACPVTHWMNLPEKPEKEICGVGFGLPSTELVIDKPFEIGRSLKDIEFFYPPPWSISSFPEKTEGWCAFQREMRKNPSYYLSEFLKV